MPFETIVTLIANVALALSLVVGVIFGLAQVKAVNRDRRERLTLEALRTFDTREFAEIIYYTRRDNFPKNDEEFEAMPEEQKIVFIQASQQMESLGMLVYERYIDIDLVDKTLGNYVTNTWQKFEPFFLNMRKSIPDPYLAEYFQWLAQRLEQKMSEQRIPYYMS
ncbi:MAG TPA: hypothetical protein VFO76_08675 [Candidatus Kapabacteria bacterium]|nr:hypothetical protein [Candidatus Kapabacteria bacterium]